MIVPVGRGAFEQRLTLVEKDVAGRVALREVMRVAFVPLTHPLAR